MDQPTQTNSHQTDDTFTLLLEYQHAEQVTTHWANRYVVQHDNNVFILSFFELLPPIILGTTQEARNAEIARLGGTIRPKGVARILIPADRMEDFIGILNKQLDKYHADNPVETEDAEN
jgi:hypothetical protein